jgi:hypothetical protein
MSTFSVRSALARRSSPSEGMSLIVLTMNHALYRLIKVTGMVVEYLNASLSHFFFGRHSEMIGDVHASRVRHKAPTIPLYSRTYY